MTYETLDLKLRTGEIVIFRNKNYYYIAIGGAGRDRFGDWRSSGRQDNKEKCLRHLGHDEPSAQSIKEDLPNWTYVESIPPTFEVVPEGTMVKNLKTGSICEITRYHRGEYGLTDDDLTLYHERSEFIIVEPKAEDPTSKIQDLEKQIQELKKSIES